MWDCEVGVDVEGDCGCEGRSSVEEGGAGGFDGGGKVDVSGWAVWEAVREGGGEEERGGRGQGGKRGKGGREGGKGTRREDSVGLMFENTPSS